MDSAPIPVANKAEIRAKIAVLQVFQLGKTSLLFSLPVVPFLFVFLPTQLTFVLFLYIYMCILNYNISCSIQQNQVRKAQKIIAEQNMQNAVKVATEMAEVAASDGKAYCVSHVDVGLDAAAVREAVVKVIEKKVSSIISLFYLAF